ncbi:MAG TPA: hypothetical protein VGR64_02185, partial [Terracidiphilus sp.]|nr:hypothetical protein [Terracidiphilus sp.]
MQEFESKWSPDGHKSKRSQRPGWRVRAICFGFGVILCLSSLLNCRPASAQSAPPSASTAEAHLPAPNAQLASPEPTSPVLASPEIEKKVDRLLKRMTLGEKIGQLVQYSDTGDESASGAQSNSSADASKIVLAINPVTANHIDAMKLASTGRLGSLLNLV